jgi:hypothetical protein
VRRLIALAVASLPMFSASAAQAAESQRFITCPIYRDADAGAKSGCWLATDPATGQQWDVSQSPYKPDWNYAVLVEGTAADTAEQPCGAPVLDPVRTSRLETQCLRHMLPAEGYPGRPFVRPARNISPLSNPPAPPPGPYSERTFTLFFELDRSFVVYQYGDYLLDQAAHWIRATKPRRLVVTGYAASEPETVSGQVIAERPAVAQQRAEVVALSLSRLFPDMEIETHAVTGAQVIDHPDADGIPGQSQRRVEITALF